ncbi:MAG: fumarate reductase subunit C [Lentisphaeria bacterium]
MSLTAFAILTLLMVHALLALRKFPADYREYRKFSTHMMSFKHGDTTLWFFQVIAGFAFFFSLQFTCIN